MQTYIRFLDNFKRLRSSPSFLALDPLDERLLELFAAVWHADGRLTVVQAMGISADMSGTTAHRRLKSLCNKGLVELVNDDTDNRIKYVMPTPRAIARFAQIGECIKQLADEGLEP